VARADELAKLQRLFFELVTAPEGVAREIEKRGVVRARIDAAIAGDERASAVERLDVYANMYFFRILDVLRGDYPKVLAVIGDDAFHNLTTDYLQAHPSRHPSLRFVGAALPAFLRAHALSEARPWLHELAALEWARVDVFDRADTATLTEAAVHAVSADDFGSIALAPIAALELLPTAFAVGETWRDVEDERSPTPPRAAPDGQALLVWRRGITVYHRVASPFEHQALRLFLGARTTFGALCAALADGTVGPPRTDDQAAIDAVELLSQWLADELLAAG